MSAKQKELILVKLGGSLITDKLTPYTERKDVIDRLAVELKESITESRQLVVGHGGGSYPHQSASKYKTHLGVVDAESFEGIAKVQNDASKLNRIVVDSMLENGLNAISFQPSAGCIAKAREIYSWDLVALREALDLGMVPVPYGDVVFDRDQGCCILSTEKLLSYIAQEVGGDRLILCGKVDGIYDADPTENSNAEKIDKITPTDYGEIKKYLTGSDGKDVTGGMLHKVKRCIDLARKGIECQVINGNKSRNLEKAIGGDKSIGTLITTD